MICSWMPPIREATTGLAFHIASATVRPKPSARLFWTMTRAWRCNALTTIAFSSRSFIGKVTRWTRRRAAVGEHGARVQHGAHGLGVEVDVLGRERVDARRDHDDPLAVEPLPGERLAREHVRVRVQQVGPQEGPCLAGELV